MKSINAIGVSERDVDRIIDAAIERIGIGLYAYSCCALSAPGDDYVKGLRIREVYAKVFTDGPELVNDAGETFRRQIEHYVSPKEWRNLRILLLSLFKAAWKDLV